MARSKSRRRKSRSKSRSRSRPVTAHLYDYEEEQQPLLSNDGSHSDQYPPVSDLERGREGYPQLANTEPSIQAITPSAGVIAAVLPFIKRYAEIAWLKTRSNRYFAIPFGIVAAWMAFVVFMLIYRSEEVLQQAAQVRISDVEVNELTEAGVDIALKGVIAMDYSNIVWLHKIVFYPIAVILGKVFIDIDGPIDVYAKLSPDIDREEPKVTYYPFSVSVPQQLWIDLSPMSVNKFELDLTIDIHSQDFSEAFTGFVIMYRSSHKRKVFYTTEVIWKSLFTITKFNTALGQYSNRRDTSVEVGASYEESGKPWAPFTISIQNHTEWDRHALIISAGSMLSIILDIQVESFLPEIVHLNFTFPFTGWTIFVEPCPGSNHGEISPQHLTSHKNFEKWLERGRSLMPDSIGALQLNPIAFKNCSSLSTTVMAIFPPVPGTSVQKPCEDVNGTGISPLNSALQKMFNGTHISEANEEFLFQPTTFSVNGEMPLWIAEVITKLGLNDVYLKLSELNIIDIHKILPSVVRVGANSAVISWDIHQGHPLMSALEVYVEFANGTHPYNYLTDLSSISGNFSLLHDERGHFGNVRVGSSGHSEALAGSRVGITLYDSEIEIVDADIVAEYANRFLKGQDSELTLETCVDVAYRKSVLDTVLKRIEPKIESISIHGDKDLTTGGVTTFIPHGLRLSSNGGDGNHPALLLQVDISNPSYESFKVSIQSSMTFDVSYNKAVIGSVILSNGSTLAHESTLDLTLYLNLDDLQQTSCLEELTSRYISNEEPRVVLSGNSESASPQELADFLKGLRIPPMAIPSFEGPGQSEDKGFVRGATFYVLSSEVQLTVYNPFEEQDVQVEIHDAIVYHDGAEIAQVKEGSKLILPPGLSTTKRIPVTYAKNVVKDVLKKAVNGNLTVQAVANFKGQVDETSMSNLQFRGEGLTARIKL